MTREPLLSIDALLGRLDMVQRLARTLVHDAAEADEVVAVALDNALRRPVAVGPEPAGWIRTVLQNVVRDRRRGEGRRKRREREAARPEALADTAEVAAGLERDREVLEEVLALDEPFRSVILQFHFEGRSTRQIAVRMERTPAVVQKQLQRAREKLRTRLESRYGGEGAWAVALLPLCKGKFAVRGAGLASVGSGVRWAAAALLLTLVGAGTWMAWPSESGQVPREQAELAGASPESLSDLDAPVEATPGTGPERALVAEVATVQEGEAVVVEDEAAQDERAPAAGQFRARLVNLDARPFANAEIEWTASSDEAAPPISINPLSLMLGRRPSGEQRVVTDSEGWALLGDATLNSMRVDGFEFGGAEWMLIFEVVDPEGLPLLVLGEAVEVGGRTLDEWGQPLSEVYLEVSCTLSALSGFDLPYMTSAFRWVSLGASAADGTFGPERVPFHPDYLLEAVRDTYSSTNVPIPQGGNLEMVIQLPAIPEREEQRIEGIVLDSDGSALSRVTLRFGQNWAQTGADGRFVMEISVWATGQPIVAETREGRFVAVAAPDRDVAYVAPEDQPVELRLPAVMPPLKGRLIDVDGQPVEGWFVHLVDGTQMGSGDQVYEFAAPGATARGLATDPEGRFEVPHLDDRDYTILVRAPKNWLLHRFEGVRGAFTEQDLELPEIEQLENLHGVVVSSSGQPVPNARVWVGVKTFEGASLSQSASSFIQTADEDGRFSFSRQGWRHVTVSAMQPDGEGEWAHVELTERPVGEIKVTLRLSGWAKLTVAGESELSWVEFRDGDGTALVTESHWPGMTSHSSRHDHSNYGRFGRFLVPDAVVEVVLGEGDEELRRASLVIEPGEQIRVDL